MATEISFNNDEINFRAIYKGALLGLMNTNDWNEDKFLDLLIEYIKLELGFFDRNVSNMIENMIRPFYEVIELCDDEQFEEASYCFLELFFNIFVNVGEDQSNYPVDSNTQYYHDLIIAQLFLNLFHSTGEIPKKPSFKSIYNELIDD